MIERKPKRRGFTEKEWAELDAHFDGWSMDQTREHGYFFQRDALAELGISRQPFRRLLEPFLEDGRLQDLGHQKGYARTGATSAVTLRDLMDLAEANVETGYRAPRGRPSAQRDRRVDRLSPGQYSDIQTVANLAAEEITGEPSNWAGVGAAWFSWDPAAGDGAGGDWKIAQHVERWVHSRAQARAEANGRSWDPKKSSSTVKKYRSALRTLLDLATTKEVLASTARHSEAYEIHAAEWEPHIQHWTEKLARRTDARPGTQRKIRQGLRTLALYATRAGSLDPRSTDWQRIRDQIMADYDRNAVSYDIMHWARSVYRSIRSRMIQKPTGSEWPGLRNGRTALVSGATITAVIKDDEAWGQWDAPGLTGGPYGLRGWLMWATAINTGALKEAGLPPRKWPRPTAHERRRLRRKPNLFRLTRGVARDRLFRFALLAGWLEEHRGIDWSASDATVLVEPDAAAAFSAWCADRKGNDDGKTTLGSAVLFSLATLASPYLEAVACERNDLDLANRLRADSEVLKEYAIEAQEQERKRIQYIATLWDAGKTGKASGGWLRLIEFRDLLIEDAVAAAGGLSVEAQIRQIRADTFCPPRPESWAVAVRAAVLVTVLRRIPLRARSVCDLTEDMWESVAPRLTDHRKARPWEGAIRLAFPQKAMKGQRAFAPWLIRQEHVGDPHHEALLRRDVVELYLMSGGARDQIRTIEGKPQASPYVFPAVASRGGGHGTHQEAREARGYRWQEGSLSSHFSNTVLAHADQLGMDRLALQDTWGATSIHVIRLLYGTHWAPQHLLEASRMLQHKDVGTTESKYCAITAADVDLEVGP